jgi:hypothetical protein
MEENIRELFPLYFKSWSSKIIIGKDGYKVGTRSLMFPVSSILSFAYLDTEKKEYVSIEEKILTPSFQDISLPIDFTLTLLNFKERMSNLVLSYSPNARRKLSKFPIISVDVKWENEEENNKEEEETSKENEEEGNGETKDSFKYSHSIQSFIKNVLSSSE